MKNKKKFQISRKLYAASSVVLCITMCAIYNSSFAQCKPMIKIDGKATVVDFNDKFGLSLPYWLKAGQTLACGSSVNAVSIIEFGADSATASLSFSRVLNIISTTAETIPAGKVWKIESISKANNSSTYNIATFGAGTYTWKVPGCAEEICIDMWGAGGGGGGYSSSPSVGGGGGGGGGGYGSQCFAVTPGTSYTVVVGSGGLGGQGTTVGSPGAAGGSSSVTGTGISMTVTGGGGGASGSTMTGGTGGSSTASSNADGANGNNGCPTGSLLCGAGGAGANGGAGGTGVTSSSNGNPGTAPGGGGGGSFHTASAIYTGGTGAPGKVIITW